MRVGILTSGGDCPGLNAALWGVTEVLSRANATPIGVRDGFKGLLNRTNLTAQDVDLTHIDWVAALREGGSLLGSSRMHPHKEEADRAAALRATADLDALIVVGGDGSLRSSAKLATHIWTHRPEFIITGIPKTIDNDVAATEAAIGFASAVQRAQDACDAASTTARSHRRIMIVEVMGRHSGALAAAVALTGSAQRCVIPESLFDPSAFVRWAHEHLGSVVVVAEGARIPGGPPHAYDENGWIRPGFPSLLLTELLASHEVPARSVVLGHVLRGGPPVAADRELGAALGVQAATDVLAQCSTLAVFRSGHVTSVPLAEALQSAAPLHEITLSRLQQLGRC